MKANKRGGARKGAGRPTGLSPGRWVQLGYAIENEIIRKMDAMHQAAVIAEVKALEPELPLNWQKLWRSKRELTNDVELIISDNQEDMKMIVHELSASNIKSTPSGLYAFAPKKAPVGITEPIIKGVARKLSHQWKVPISFRTAQRCWRDHQSHMARLRKGGEDDYIPKPD